MSSIKNLLLSTLAAASLFVLALPASALTHVLELAPADAVKIDARDADVPTPSTESTLKLVLNRSSDGETPNSDDQSRLLFTLPAEIFDAPTSRVARALLTLSSTYTKNYDARPLYLHPLAAPFSLSNTTWNARDLDTPWTAPGGDFLTNAFVSAVYDTNSATVAFDIAPLLADPATAAALQANGAIVRFDAETPMDVKFMQLTFASPAYADDPGLLPSLRCALLDPFSDARDFAVSYIDSRDASTVYWEQALATVGKVILNGADGSECRAIVSMPESLAALPPALVQSVVARFDAEIRDWEGEAIFLSPLTTPTKLERHPSNETSPVHGPSWNCADASVDTNATSYVIGGETFDNSPWEVAGGDWMADTVVRGTVTAPVKGTTGTAEFDLTALWHDDAARTALLANGAIVFMDPAAFPKIKADARMTRVNLYRPDETVEFYKHAVSWMRVTEYERLSDDSSIATTYIDSGSPDKNFSAANKTLVTLNNVAQGTESRALAQLPPSLLDIDPLAVGSVNLLVSYYRSWPGDDGVNPIALHPAATAFRLDQATWNNAAADTAWASAGGDFLDAFVIAADSSSQSTLTFDLAPLLANEETAAALAANGAVIRMHGDAPGASNNNGYNVNGSLTATPPVIVLAPADLEIRGIDIDVEAGKLAFSVAGLEPLRPYELQACSDLAAGDWQTVDTVPETGHVTLDLLGALPFYRVKLSE